MPFKLCGWLDVTTADPCLKLCVRSQPIWSATDQQWRREKTGRAEDEAHAATREKKPCRSGKNDDMAHFVYGERVQFYESGEIL
jgi:hypothetical protein